MNRVLRHLAVCASAFAAAGGAFADTVTMKDHVTYDGKILNQSGGLIRMQVGDRELVLPAADVASAEANDKRGQTVNYDDIERLAAGRDRELLEKTGLTARKRAAVDSLLRELFSGNEAATQRARRALLDMVKADSPYRYLEMQWEGILSDKLAPLLELMFEMNPEGMREILKENASSTSETARAACLRCLARLKDQSSLELMKRGLADEYPEVRIAAAHGVAALAAREATPVLLDTLKTGEMRLGNASRDALSVLWTEPGQPPLNFEKNLGWEEFWKSRAASVPGAWDLNSIEPLVPPGTVCLRN